MVLAKEKIKSYLSAGFFLQRFYTRNELQSTQPPWRHTAKAPPRPAANGG